MQKKAEMPNLTEKSFRDRSIPRTNGSTPVAAILQEGEDDHRVVVKL